MGIAIVSSDYPPRQSDLPLGAIVALSPSTLLKAVREILSQESITFKDANENTKETPLMGPSVLMDAAIKAFSLGAGSAQQGAEPDEN